ncbi:MAG: hypothetical protein KJO98_07005, partial [Rhodothermia bacterium]|nr:hypothetical protein [Rhodothermia bacterium]
LQSTLTDEQKQRLLERASNPTNRAQAGPRADESGTRRSRRIGRGGPNGGLAAGHMHAGALRELLTEEQQSQVDQIRESYREQLNALRDQVSSGALTREEARVQAGELRDAMRSDIDALLTDEQRTQLEEMHQSRLEEREARREAAGQVRNEVLDLDTDSAAALDAILDEFREAVQTLRDELRTSEADRDEMHAAVQALKETRDEEVAALLDEVGFEIYQIHGALHHRLRRHTMRGGGNRGIGQHGPGNAPFGSFGNAG